MVDAHRNLVCLALIVLGGGCTSEVTPDGGRADAGVDASPADASTVVATDAGPPDAGRAPRCEPGTCDDGDFCNGVERCDPDVGCVSAERGPCDDGDVCTTDACDGAAESCSHQPRDVDGDGDVDARCGGTDCDDLDPSRRGTSDEICVDFVDNDCDLDVDESACVVGPHDSCADPLDVSAGGRFLLNTRYAAADHPTGCGTSPDLVASFTITEARSVDIQAEDTRRFGTTLSLRTDCADASTELLCRPRASGNHLQLRSLPAGTYFLVVGATVRGDVVLDVALGPALPPIPNETCDGPIDVSAGGRFSESTIEATDDHSTACGDTGRRDLVYTFTTTESQDVRVGLSGTGARTMTVDLQTSCGVPSTSARCTTAVPPDATLHELPAGTYYLMVEAPDSTDVDFDLDVEFLAPTPSPPGDACTDPDVLTLGVPVTGRSYLLEDDLQLSCGDGGRDAVYAFTTTAARDVTITVEGLASPRAISVRSECDVAGSELRCTYEDPGRVRLWDLAAGTYYVIVEGRGEHIITVDARPPQTPEAVTGNTSCETAHVVPITGGLFSGTTTGAGDDYSASCDPTTSADVAFELTLPTDTRVVASTEGAAFNTLLHVHRDACVSGAEVYCDHNSGEGSSSLIDEVLPAGTWYFVIDGPGAFTLGSYLFEVLVDP